VLLDDVAWLKSCAHPAGSGPLATAAVMAVASFASVGGTGFYGVDSAKQLVAIHLVAEPVVFAVLAVGFLLVVVVLPGVAPRQSELVNKL